MKNFPLTALSVLAVLVCGTSQIFAVGNAPKAAGEAIPGNIRVLKVKGDVTRVVDKSKAAEPLKAGMFIQQDQVIKTGKGSEAMLLLSNGTTITVEQNTLFHVDKFLQTPFDSSQIKFQGLKTEPSTSQTKLHVQNGSIIADVCKLGKGSTFDIGTPVGVAGIRGTLIQVTVNTTAGGSVSVTINLPQGLSDFATTDGQQITLSNGQTVTVSSNPVTGTMIISGVNPLNAQTIQQIQALAEQVAAAIPATQAFEGVPDGAPEQLGGTTGADQAGGLGGDQGAGDVGTAPPIGGSGGGGGGGGGGVVPTPTPTPTPTPNPPPS
ncbi:MAG: FecR domain-containing protein [Verrucomicrobiae bacterium]